MLPNLTVRNKEIAGENKMYTYAYCVMLFYPDKPGYPDQCMEVHKTKEGAEQSAVRLNQLGESANDNRKYEVVPFVLMD